MQNELFWRNARLKLSTNPQKKKIRILESRQSIGPLWERFGPQEILPDPIPCAPRVYSFDNRTSRLIPAYGRKTTTPPRPEYIPLQRRLVEKTVLGKA